MNILYQTDTLQQPTAVTIGFFDGVHCGHRFLLTELQKQAALRNLMPLPVTFTNHPQRFFHPQKPLSLLTTTSEKLARLAQINFTQCLMLPFDAHTAAMSSAEFMYQLHEHFGMRCLLIGYDHHFGSDRTATFEDYYTAGSKLGVEVLHGNKADFHGVTVSSSKIRRCLQKGDIVRANAMLGYSYELSGSVAHGNRIGRQLGFPTANMQLPAEKLLPADGVYATEVVLDGQLCGGMLNIGLRPTLHTHERTVEVHLLNFDGDLYGKPLTLRLRQRVRDEQRFATLDALQAQLQRDRTEIQKILSL